LTNPDKEAVSYLWSALRNQQEARKLGGWEGRRFEETGSCPTELPIPAYTDISAGPPCLPARLTWLPGLPSAGRCAGQTSGGFPA